MKIDRRKFLQASLAMSVSGLAGVPIYADTAPNNISLSGKIKNIGVQLYTVRDQMALNPEATIAKVAELGYKEIEFAGYFDRTAKQIKNTLDQEGLSAPSTHVDISETQSDKLKALIEYSNIVGHKYIIVPFLPPNFRNSLDKFKMLADQFSEIGEECNRGGIKFAYHNHEFEFDEIEGVRLFDYLLSQVDENLLTMQMDLHWIIKAGYDPIKYFNRYPGRFPLCHVKDLTTEGTMVDVGHGKIDFASIFAHSETAGLKHFIVEHDEPKNSMQSITNSYAHLESMIIK